MSKNRLLASPEGKLTICLRNIKFSQYRGSCEGCDMATFKKKSFPLCILPCLFLFLTACTMAGKPSIGQDLQGGSARLPSRLLVLPVKVTINELTAGGMVQQDPDWSKQGEKAMAQAVREFFKTGLNASRAVGMPQLSEEEAELVRQHILLYHVVALEATIAKNLPGMGWSHLAGDFHYTLGPGLNFLKQRSGAEAALIVIGNDNISSGGRKTMVTMAALVGVAMPLGASTLVVGVIDLEDGDILWFQQSVGTGNLDLRNPRDASTLFAKAMEGYGSR